MKSILKAAWLTAAPLLLVSFLSLVEWTQEVCSPKYEIEKTEEGLYQVIDCQSSELVAVFDQDPRMEGYEPPQLNAYPYLSGFPIYFNDDGINTNVIPADIDNDQQLEICLPHGANPNYYYYIFRADGSNQPGFPKAARVVGVDTAIYDCLTDGNLDYFISKVADGGIWEEQFWDALGSTLPGWPYLINQSTQGWITNTSIDDVSNDGIYKIFAYGQKYQSSYYYPWIWGWDEFGNLLQGFPKQTTIQASAGYTTPAIADLDNDGIKEVIFALNDNSTTILALKPDGSNAEGFPVSLGIGRPYQPQVGDVDGDGWNEIVFSTGGRIWVLSHNGLVKPNWPKPTIFINYEPECQGAQKCGGGVGVVSLGDLNYDGKLEIVCGTINSTSKAMLFVFNDDGTYYPGWPILMSNPNLGFRGAAIGDIDGDCISELIFAAYNTPSNQSGLYAYHIDATMVSGFPLFVATDIMGPIVPTLTDLNNDGYLDIGIVTDSSGSPFGTLEFFNLAPNPYNRSCIEWPMAHFDIRNTGRYRKLYQIDKNSSFTVDKTAIPADGESKMLLTACATTEGQLPSNFNGDLSGQDVRFARNPINGTFTGPIIDHSDGSYSRYIQAPLSDDPLTTNLMCWINEFKLNTIIPVTFWGRPVVSSYTPNLLIAGKRYTITICGRNFPFNITAESNSSNFKITDLRYKGQDEVEIDVSVSELAEGYYSIKLFGYKRLSEPMTFIVYNIKDLLLLGNKPSATDANFYWVGLDDYPDIQFKLIRATNPDFSDATKIYEGTNRNYIDPEIPNQIYYYKVEY
jgi:hypothetical protein